MKLENKVAIVTGAGSTIGRAICLRFAEEGARVLVADKDEATGRQLVEAIAESGREATFSHVDVTDEAAIQAMVGDAIVAYGSLHVLVNGTSERIAADALTLSREQWQSSLALNLESAWLCSRYCAPFLKAAGGGSIIHIASTHALRTMPRSFPYATSKGALIPMSRSLAIDFGPQNIRSNVLVPGHVQSDHNERLLRDSSDPEGNFRRVLAVHPLGRIGRPEDVAAAACFLASDDATFVTGTTLVVDGGRSAVIQELHDWK